MTGGFATVAGKFLSQFMSDALWVQSLTSEAATDEHLAPTAYNCCRSYFYLA